MTDKSPKAFSRKMDKFTIRGIIYSIVAISGFGYEVVFNEKARLIVLGGYSLIFIVGLACILFLKEKNEDDSGKP
ncbi:hypothetical protein JXJ21_21840 [candidate division KSB1 bacterium]|nr:hypothetical protein [candidate division KSB1 bacterium]